MIIGISGVATDKAGNKGTVGVGKDEVADHLEKKHHAVKVAMADPLKRICRDVFDFSVKQLWGPSQYRNEPDERYQREEHVGHDTHYVCDCCKKEIAGGGQCFLTPRYALQLLGTEWGRHCFDNAWVLHALRSAKEILENGHPYSQRLGVKYDTLTSQVMKVVAVPDMRFHNEFKAIRAGGGKVIRVKRTVEKIVGGASTHQSETELLSVPDDDFDYVLDNDGDLDLLFMKTDRMMDVFNGRILKYREDQEDVPPFKRGTP